MHSIQPIIMTELIASNADASFTEQCSANIQTGQSHKAMQKTASTQNTICYITCNCTEKGR